MSRDANITIKVAKDGSKNYGAATQHFLGEEGAFCVPVIRRRCGSARQFAVRVSCTSPTRVDFLAMAMQAERES
jgi:hypothetical protein